MRQVFRQVGLDAAFDGVDFQPRKDFKHLGFLAQTLTKLVIGVFVIRDNTAVKGRVTHLPDAGGEGAADGLKPRQPVVRVPYHRLGRRNLQKRNAVAVAIGIIVVISIITGDTCIQQRVGDGLDHVAVKIRTAQPFRDQRAGIHHDDIVQMRQIFLPQITD